MHDIQEGTGTGKLRNEEAVTDVGIPCYLSSIQVLRVIAPCNFQRTGINVPVGSQIWLFVGACDKIW
jgi:hypothetical protein